MILHLIKLAWNRKWSNFLILLEIVISFLILFVAVLQLVHYANLYHLPLGFEYENVWIIRMDARTTSSFLSDQFAAQQRKNVKHILAVMKEFPEIEETAAAIVSPFTGSSTSFLGNCSGNMVTDSFKDVMKLDLVSGRWFSKEDDRKDWWPVVINERMAREYFGNESPLGKTISESHDSKKHHVIGVLRDFRKNGEFTTPENYAFWRFDLNEESKDIPGAFIIKVRPGTSADLEEKLLNRIQAVAHQSSFHIEQIESVRRQNMKDFIAPLSITGVACLFLFVMVGLGLTGVLWQNVTRRTREFGLRRANGATAARIYLQILGEILVATTFGMLVGTLIIIQFPLLDLLGFMEASVYISSFIISVAFMYLLVILCALYPSWLATRIQPVEALHYE